MRSLVSSLPPRPPWLLPALTAAVCWGVWGVLAKGPSRELSGWMTQLLFTVALVPSAIYAAMSPQLYTGTDRSRGLFWGFLSGLLAAAGNICFYLALEAGAETAIAVPLTNIYPLVTALIAYFWFHEKLNRLQLGGLALAVVAIILLSGEAKLLHQPLALLRHLGLTPWILYALGAVACWGIFSALQKVSTNYVSAEMSYLAWCASFLPVAGWIIATRPLDWNLSPAMAGSALAAGVCNSFGVIAAFAAYRCEGKAAIVTTLAAAVQPLVTVVLALLFLGERFGRLETVGIGLAIVASVALSQETPPPTPSHAAPPPPPTSPSAL